MAQVFNRCEGFSHSLERLCHQAKKLMGKDKPNGGEGEGEVIFAEQEIRFRIYGLLILSTNNHNE